MPYPFRKIKPMINDRIYQIVSSWEKSSNDIEEDDIVTFSINIEEGDIVTFSFEGQITTGSVEHVMVDGYFGIPGSRFYTQATQDNPALLIRIWMDNEETELMVGRMAAEVSKV
jgi:hypothetical protein